MTPARVRSASREDPSRPWKAAPRARRAISGRRRDAVVYPTRLGPFAVACRAIGLLSRAHDRITIGPGTAHGAAGLIGVLAHVNEPRGDHEPPKEVRHASTYAMAVLGHFVSRHLRLRDHVHPQFDRFSKHHVIPADPTRPL